MEKMPTTHTVQQLLLDEMKYGSYSHSVKLPRESLLAEKLCISRTQLRDTLAELEREGFISRRQGVGTIINRHVLDVTVRMDLEIEFMEMVRRSGYAASEKVVKICFLRNGDAAAKLGIGRNDELLLVSRVVTADDEPVIFCEDYIPRSIIKRNDYTELDLESPIFYFLKHFCHKEAYMDITEIRPLAAVGDIAERLRVQEGTPILFMDEVDFDFEGIPVMYARQYYIDGIIKHTVTRRKL